MPFTLSHTAVVLPLSRLLARRRVLSAVLIGSMVPDFGLFMPWRPARVETHGAWGLLTFCLPVGLLAYGLFQRVIKSALMAVLPDPAYARWRPFGAATDLGSPKQWFIAACGVVAGAATHLIWDGFTHEGARGVRMFPALDDPMFDIAGHHLVGARLLQDVSSLLGLLVVLAFAAYELRPPGAAAGEPPPRGLTAPERRLWVLGYAVVAALLSGGFLFLRHLHDSYVHATAAAIGLWAVAVLRGGAVALLLVSLAVNLRVRGRANP